MPLLTGPVNCRAARALPRVLAAAGISAPLQPVEATLDRLLRTMRFNVVRSGSSFTAAI